MQKRSLLAIALVSLLTSCGGGGANPPPFVAPTSPAGPAGQLSASPSSATLKLAAGPVTLAVTVTTNIAGTVSETDTCGGTTPVATVAINGTSGQTTTSTVTAKSPGTCTITYTSSAGGSATVAITVTP